MSFLTECSCTSIEVTISLASTDLSVKKCIIDEFSSEFQVFDDLFKKKKKGSNLFKCSKPDSISLNTLSASETRNLIKLIRILSDLHCSRDAYNTYFSNLCRVEKIGTLFSASMSIFDERSQMDEDDFMNDVVRWSKYNVEKLTTSTKLAIDPRALMFSKYIEDQNGLLYKRWTRYLKLFLPNIDSCLHPLVFACKLEALRNLSLREIALLLLFCGGRFPILSMQLGIAIESKTVANVKRQTNKRRLQSSAVDSSQSQSSPCASNEQSPSMPLILSRTTATRTQFFDEELKKLKAKSLSETIWLNASIQSVFDNFEAQEPNLNHSSGSSTTEKKIQSPIGAHVFELATTPATALWFSNVDRPIIESCVQLISASFLQQQQQQQQIQNNGHGSLLTSGSLSLSASHSQQLSPLAEWLSESDIDQEEVLSRLFFSEALLQVGCATSSAFCFCFEKTDADSIIQLLGKYIVSLDSSSKTENHFDASINHVLPPRCPILIKIGLDLMKNFDMDGKTGNKERSQRRSNISHSIAQQLILTPRHFPLHIPNVTQSPPSINMTLKSAPIESYEIDDLNLFAHHPRLYIARGLFALAVRACNVEILRRLIEDLYVRLSRKEFSALKSSLHAAQRFARVAVSEVGDVLFAKVARFLDACELKLWNAPSTCTSPERQPSQIQMNNNDSNESLNKENHVEDSINNEEIFIDEWMNRALDDDLLVEIMSTSPAMNPGKTFGFE